MKELQMLGVRDHHGAEPDASGAHGKVQGFGPNSIRP
jgi:hypothetical protein